MSASRTFLLHLFFSEVSGMAGGWPAFRSNSSEKRSAGDPTRTSINRFPWSHLIPKSKIDRTRLPLGAKLKRCQSKELKWRADGPRSVPILQRNGARVTPPAHP